MRKLVLAFLLMPLLSQSKVLADEFVQGLVKQELLSSGKMLYEKRCAGCHGTNGDGNGPAAAFLDPLPRNFTTGIFKFRSTPLGSLPTDKDLMNVLAKGVMGTSMPSFAEVPEQQRFAIVEYIKTFSKVWSDPAQKRIEVIGAPYPEEDFTDYKKFIARAEKGRKVYVEACAVCHGKEGLGNGPGSEGLVDDWGRPIKPGNFSKPYIKSGKSVRDIYRTLLTGVGGTPMPSFKDSYSDDQLWDLAAWVLYMRGIHNGYEPKDVIPFLKDEEIK